MNQPILLYRSGSVYANETAAWAALDAVTHKKGQPIVAFYTLSSPVSGHHGSSTIGAIFAIGIGDGVGQYKACTSHDDMLIVAQSLNAHITQFNQMFEYDATHNAIKAKLDFYTTDGKSISAGGIGSGSSASLGALYQLVDVMANSSNTGVEGAVEGSVLAYDATAGKWKAIAQSEILPDMSGYYTKDETDSAINTAKSNLQGKIDTIQALIPATATADNQLADKDFVNSSIATATAEFKGSFTSLDELKATSGNLNDYAFYLHTDSVGNSIVDRYKWTTAGWLYEYTLNNSSFTAEQWAALNSAITATLVQSYNSHLNNTTIHITTAERTAWNNKWDYNEETIKAVKVNAAVLSDSATKLQTPRTLWGRTFDGTGDVWGTIIIKASAGLYHCDSYGNYLAYIGHDYVNPYAHIYNLRSGSSIRVNDDGNICIPKGNVLIGTTTDNGYKLDVNGTGHYAGDLVCGGEVVAVAGEGTPAGVTDYSALTGKPQINGVTLVSGNNTLASLGIQAAGDYATNSGVTTLLANYADKTFVSNNYAGKAAFNNHTADTDIHITASERTAWNAKWTYDEATIKAVKVTSASSADSVAWSGIKDKPLTFTPSAHTHTASEISGLPTNLSAFTNDVGYITGITKSMVEGVLTGEISSHTHSYLPLSGGTIDTGSTTNAVPLKINTNYSIETALQVANNGSLKSVFGWHQTYGTYLYSHSNNYYLGIKDDGTPHFSNFGGSFSHTLIHAGNYNSYAPTLTGTGASGTWGISISGNAASATKLATPRTIWGQSFNGTGNVDGALTINAGGYIPNRATLVLNANTNNPSDIIFKCNSNTIGNYGWWAITSRNDNTGKLAIYRGGENGVNSAEAEILAISPNGNVLIGITTDNGYRLQVNGSERVYGDLIVDGEVSALVA